MIKVLLTMGLFRLPPVWARHASEIERYHNPKIFTTTMNPIVDLGTDTKRPHTRYTPDFRLEEPMLEPWNTYYVEHNRPYRVSPHKKQTREWSYYENPHMFGCYCTTVYKRLRLLAGCAVVTTRHILTTASSTELVLRRHRKARTLENILGAWYDNTLDTYNSSMYMTPSRIHFHPLFTMPSKVNRTHPFPVMFDLSIWAATYYLHPNAVICGRGSPHKWDMQPSTPSRGAWYYLFGFQFMRAYSRRPLPWFRYTVRLAPKDAVIPCPKTEWGWYHCFKTGSWAPLGFDQGGALHRHTDYYGGYRHDGLLGLNVISLKLRSVQMLSYFLDVNTHKALDFFYAAYNGKLQCVWLDGRFEDSFNRAPVAKEYIRQDYPHDFFYAAYNGKLQCVWLDGGFEDSFNRAPVAKEYIRQDYPHGRETYSSISCCLSERDRTGFT